MARTEVHAGLPRGSLVALVTPFQADGSIDVDGLRRLIDWHIGQGTSGLVIAGTTGEASTLSFDEHTRLLREAVSHAARRIPVMAGVGANATAEAIALARMARDAGADSMLSVVPYYNKPTQEGLLRHFLAQADATDLPLVLYSVAGRTVVDLSLETILKLAAHPNIRGIKDASGDMVRAQDIASVVPDRFALYSGDDFTTLPYLVMGGWGVISVTANVVPQWVSGLCTCAAAGDLVEARRLSRVLHPLTQVLFCETNPIPVKHAVSLLGMVGADLRLPLTPLPADLVHRVGNVMRDIGVVRDSIAAQECRQA